MIHLPIFWVSRSVVRATERRTTMGASKARNTRSPTHISTSAIDMERLSRDTLTRFLHATATTQVDWCTVGTTQIIKRVRYHVPTSPASRRKKLIYALVTPNMRASSFLTLGTCSIPAGPPSRRLRANIEIMQGNRPGCVRYRDFVEAMGGEVCTSRDGRANATGGGGSVGSRKTGSRANHGGERRRRSSADDIEHVVDRLKEVRACFEVLDCVNYCCQIPYADGSSIASTRHTQTSPTESSHTHVGELDSCRLELTTFFNVP